MARIEITALVPDREMFTDPYDSGLYLDYQSKTAFQLSELEGGTDYVLVEGKGFTYNKGDITGGTVTSVIFKDANNSDYASFTRLKLKIGEPIAGDSPYWLLETSFSGNDRVTGSPEADALLAGTGKNSIRGLGGDDLILAGSDGGDTVTGGLGSDTFMFAGVSLLDSKMIVNDFDADGGGVDQDYFFPMLEGPFKVFKAGDDTKIDFQDGGTVILKGVDRGDFDDGDIKDPYADMF